VSLPIENLEKRNRELEQLLHQSTAALQLANNELEFLAYAISHDLRAPLKGLDGLSHALITDCAGTLDSLGKQYLEQISGTTRRINQLIDALLELSQAGRRPLQRERINLSVIAHGIAHQLRQRQPERTVEILIEPEMVREADETLMRAAISKLLENAWKFTSKRNLSRIELKRVERDNKSVFVVRDNGAGFNMDYADKLFAPFQRLHGVDEFPGVGIGLAVAQRIIARHGGRIWAESKPDQGASFYFAL
jgi:light-regulated signal transduction histidine kinase (bacteriophytochrome)